MLKGSIPAIITPFSKGEVDFDCFANLLKWQIKEGISGVTVCGTTGESPTLTHDEHMKLVEFAVKVAGRKIPVIAGTGSNSTKEAIEFTKHAYKSGANYGLVVTPYYNKPNQKGLINHFKKIAKVTPLKQIIYNIPGRSIVDLSYESFKELNKISNIVGIKDASNDLSRPTHIKKYIKHKKFYQLSGEDATQLAFLAQGGDGVISVTANIVPKKVADLHKSWFTGDISQAMKIDTELFSLNNALFLEANPCPVKYAAFKLGICNYELRLPLCKILEKNELIVDNVLKDLNITFD